MIGHAGRLAEATVLGTVHRGADHGSTPARISVVLIGADGGGEPAVYIGRTSGGGTAYEIPVSALKAAITALPLKELFRVVREARA